MKNNPELYKSYLAVKGFYGGRKAKRSGVHLIKHIDEGLDILNKLKADEYTKAAYCLHPLFQNDLDLGKNYTLAENFHPMTILYVMEYRKTANSYLCKPHTDSYGISDVPFTPIQQVRQMLLADKLQNQKDFLKYHADTHPRAKELTKYFKNWIDALKV